MNTWNGASPIEFSLLQLLILIRLKLFRSNNIFCVIILEICDKDSSVLIKESKSTFVNRVTLWLINLFQLISLQQLKRKNSKEFIHIFFNFLIRNSMHILNFQMILATPVQKTSLPCACRQMFRRTGRFVMTTTST